MAGAVSVAYPEHLSDLALTIAFSKDRWEDCHKVLTLVHGHGDPNSPFVLYELNDIREMCQFEARNSDASYMELFTPKMINRTHIGKISLGRTLDCLEKHFL